MQLPDKSFVISNAARSYFWKGEGLFSIKHFRGGHAYYDVGHGTYKVCNPNYLLLNHQQEYSIAIESAKPVESFTVFFQSDLIKSVYSSLTSTMGKIMERHPASNQPEFHLSNSTFNTAFHKQFHNFRISYQHNKTNKLWLDEKLALLAEHIIRENLQNVGLIDKLSSYRFTTREEIFRRLLVAKEYLYANCEKDITLEELSKTALLSINHLIRHFKELFGATPHQYLTQLRMERSKHLLTNTDATVSEIVSMIGFSSVPSFCTLFMRLEGLSPTDYRFIARKTTVQ